MSMFSPHAAPEPPPDWTCCWFDLIGSAVRLGKQAQKELLRHLHGSKLNETQFLVLWQICQAPEAGLPQSELVESLGLSKAQISQQLERLRQSGLILGVRPKSDRRCQQWCSTPDGTRLANEVAARVRRCPGESQGLSSGIERLSAQSDRLPTQAELRIFRAEEPR